MQQVMVLGGGGLHSPVDPSFRALPGQLKFTVRRHQFNKRFILWQGCTCAVDAPTEDLSLLRDPGCEVQGHSKVIPQPYLTVNVCEVVLQKSIPAQIR